MDLLREYSALRKLAADYETMSHLQQRAYDQRLGAWMLAADIAADVSLAEDVSKMRRTMATKSPKRR
jgi:hypothetical protein